MAAISKQQEERNRKAQEAIKAKTKQINERRREIAEGKGGDKYLTRKQIDEGLTETPYRQRRHQEALLENKEYDEIMDQIVPKGTMARRIKNDPQKYAKYVSAANKSSNEPSFWKGVSERTENIENYTPQQRELMDFLGREYKTRLPNVLDRLEKPVVTPMSSQLEQMFGHMQNPILQGIINPYLGQNVQPLFPSQLAQQSSGGIENLLGQLGNAALQYGIQNAPSIEDLNKYGQQYGQQLGQYGEQLGGNLMNLLSGLTSRFRGNQQPLQP